jgi:PAS domain S-box-containing protein
MWKERLPANSHSESKTTLSLDEARGHAGAATDIPARSQKDVLSLSHLAEKCWGALRCWLQANSLSPRWLPRPLRRPVVGYLAALLVEIVAILGILLLTQWRSEFLYTCLLPILGVMLVALNWGTLPGLLATLWGVSLLGYLISPDLFSWNTSGRNDPVSLLLFLLVGSIISVVAGQHSWNRRRAEETACSLREEQIRTKQEQLRLRTLFNVLPAAVGMVDAQGRFLEKTPACKALWGEAAPMPYEIADYQWAKAWWPDSGKHLSVEEWGMSRALTQGEFVTNQEVEIETADGQHKVIVDTATPIRDETGAIIGAVGLLQDITEHKRLEEALRQAERQAASRASQLEAVFEAMTEAVLVFDSEGRILQRNAADRQMFTFATEPRTLAERLPLVRLRDEHGQPLPRGFASHRLLKGELMKDVAGTDHIASTSNGEDILLNVTGAPMRDAEGRVVGGVMVMRNISERKRLEREVARRAVELEVIFETMVDGVYVYDREGRIMRANSAGRRLFSLDEHPELSSLPFFERISHYDVCFAHDPHLPHEHWPLMRMLRGEVLSDPDAVDVSYHMLNGREVEGSITGAPLRDAEGRIIGAVMVLRDLTERQRLERRTHEALQALLAMAEALVQAPNESTSLGRGDGLEANLVAHRLATLTSNLLGCSSVSISSLDLERGSCEPLAVLGLSPEEEQRWWAGERRSARWMDGAHTEVLARLQAGETLAMDMNDPLLCEEPNPYHAQFCVAVPMRVGERLVGLLILNPKGNPPRYTPHEIVLAEATAKLGALVIERERLLREREAAQASELAQRQANQRMDAFLGMASHELKTPLTTIILGLQWGQRRFENLLREETVASDGIAKKLEAMCEQLTHTSRQASRLDRLVNDLLDVSRIQADKLAFHVEPIDLESIICEVVQQQRKANPQRLILEYIPDNQDMLVSADAGRIEQVVTNYLTNALKYSAEDEPVEIGAMRGGGAVRVWVRDHGPGIPVAEQEHIWERFHQAPGVEVRSGSGVGLGLGLYISKVIVNRHHGQVGVESVPGEGATFWFTLPLENVSQKHP